MSSRPPRLLAAVLVSLLTVLAGLAVTTPTATAAPDAAPDAAPRAAAPAAKAAHRIRDGRIAFVRGDQIYSMNRWGGQVRKLTRKGRNSHPQWSPDGRRIAYLHESKGRRDIWVMSSGGKRQVAVTTSGDVTSEGATWSAEGRRLAYATPELVTIRSRYPFGDPVPAVAYQSGGFCDEGDVGQRDPVYVDRFLSWSPDGTRIAVLNHNDCFFDDRIDHYRVAFEELAQYAASGGDCCGYLDWTDLFWGPDNQFGYSEQDLGPYGDDVDAPVYIVYPGFRSLPGDRGGAPSPTGTYVAVGQTTAAGQAVVVRARADGYGRRVLANGSQPDWQTRPR